MRTLDWPVDDNGYPKLPPLGFQFLRTPHMLLHLHDGESLIDISIQHCLYQVYGGLRHDPWYAQFVIQNLVDAVERVFLVN